MAPLPSLLLALLLVAPSATAQQAFRLTDPVLLVDGQAVPIAGGGALEATPFDALVVTVPGHGGYVVSDRPFAGARHAGQFSGTTLAFTLDGRSVRLRGAEPLLDGGPADAFVRFTSADDGREGHAVLSVRTAPESGAAAPAGRRRTERSDDGARRAADRLDAASRPVAAGRDRLRGTIGRFDADRDRAAEERTRLDAERARLDAEQAALRRDVEAYDARARRYSAERARLGTGFDDRRRAALEAEHSGLVAERDRLERERQRLDAEGRTLGRAVGALSAETARLVGERERVADEQDRLVRERDALVAEQQRLLTEVTALRRSADALAGETRRLRAAHDAARRTAAPPAALQAAPAPRPAPRPRAEPRSDLAALTAERDALRREADALRAELGRLAAERDANRRRAAARAPEPRPAPAGAPAAPAGPARNADDAPSADDARVADERDAYAAANAALRRERDALDARLQTTEAERAALVGAQDQLEADRALLAAERDALHREAEALRAELYAHEGALPARPRDGVLPATAPMDAPSAGETDGSSVSLPGFDWARLQNPEEVAALLRAAPYPPDAALARVEGDALVLFVTDDTGRVVEATVAEALGYGLDAVAEGLVRAMHFRPPVWDGMPTVLRAQVVVRFER